MVLGGESRVRAFCLVAALLLLTVAASSINGQNICNVPISGLMACKPSVTLPNPATPSGECCSALSHANMRCLCSYRNSKLLPSLGIDPNLAMQLPAKCNLPHPPNC